MALREIDPNIGRHDSISRSSNVSGKGSLKDFHPAGGSSAPDGIASQAGVLSMLKTTTETGDIGVLGQSSNRLHQIPHATPRHQPGIAPSRTSSHYSRAGSLKSKSSIRSKASDHTTSDRHPVEPWPYPRYPHSGSLDLSHQQSDSLIHQTFRSPTIVLEQQESEQRSYSLTRVPVPLPPHRSLSKHRSATSLRSHGPNAARPRSPFMYPTRLRRPGFRPGSPAWNDTKNSSYARPLNHQQGPAHAFNGLSTPPPSSYDQQPSFAIPRPTQVPRQYTPAEFHNPSLHGYVRSPKPVHPLPVESRFQQRLQTNSVSHAPALPLSRFQQPNVFNSSPLSNGSHQAGLAEPCRPSNSDTTSQMGFVQRVKQALEEKASGESGYQKSKLDSPKPRAERPIESSVEETPSPPIVKRLTRDMIKAAVGPPSDTGAGSSPDAADYLQAEDSTLGGSSIRAGPSMELPRSSPDRTIEFTKYFAASPNGQTWKNPEPEEAHELMSGTERMEAPEELASDDPTDPSIIINSPPNSDHSLPQVDVSKSGIQTNGSDGAEINELLHPHHFADQSKKHASLPQPQSLKIGWEAGNHQSLPVPTNSGRAQNIVPPSSSAMTKHAIQESLAAPKPTAGTEELFSTEPTFSSILRQPSTYAGSHLTAETEVTSSTTEIAQAGSRYSSSRLKSSTELSDSFGTPASRFQDTVEPTLPSIAANATATLGESHPRMENGMALPPSASTTNDRFSAMKQFHFPLPDLTEDSQEDSNTSNLKMLGSRPPNFRSAGFKQVKREHRAPTHAAILPAPAASYVSRKLINTRNMPSLHFSQIDLTTKLNLALNVEPSNSAETLFRSVPGDDTDPNIGDAIDQGLKRERYKSFFSEIDDLSGSEDICKELGEGNQPEIQQRNSNNELVNEIDKISIPSVNGLTLRLSQLLPAIKKCDSEVDLETEEMDPGDENEDTNEIGQNGDARRAASSRRKEKAVSTTLTAGSVARMRRSTQGASEVDGVSGLEKSKSRLMKELPPLPEGKNDQIRKSKLSQQTNEDTENMPVELEATLPLSKKKGEVLDMKSSRDSRAMGSKLESKSQQPARSIAGTSDSRPWNASSNYPWNESSLAIEISPLRTDGESPDGHVPVNSTTAPTDADGLSRSATERIVRSMSPGQHVDTTLVPRSENAEESDPFLPSRAGIIGSLQRKIGRKSRIDKVGFPIDALLLHTEERVTEPGDRYPTTGLTPPSHSNVEEAQSYFSDDSSDHRRPRAIPIRKRLTRLRHRRSGSKRSAQLRSISQAGSHTPFPHSGFWTGIRDSLSDRSNRSGSNPNIVAVYDRPLPGMSKFEYRAKRFVEKLRIFWCRSGNAIRSMSRARRHPQIWYEPGELYEGV